MVHALKVRFYSSSSRLNAKMLWNDFHISKERTPNCVLCTYKCIPFFPGFSQSKPKHMIENSQHKAHRPFAYYTNGKMKKRKYQHEQWTSCDDLFISLLTRTQTNLLDSVSFGILTLKIPMQFLARKLTRHSWAQPPTVVSSVRARAPLQALQHCWPPQHSCPNYKFFIRQRS